MRWYSVIHASLHPMKTTKDTRNCRFTNRFNITKETNLVWKNSHNTNNMIIVIFSVMSKIVIMFRKQIHTRHQ